MPEKQGPTQFEFYLAHARVERASFTVSLAGDQMSYRIAELADDQLAGLERAIQNHRPVLLMFEPRPVLLDLMSCVRKGPGAVEIVGHIVGDMR
jgi:hypothetical protein